MEDLAGYRGMALEYLRRAKAGIGDVISVKNNGAEVTGTVVPRYSYGDDAHVVLKLRSGYNVSLLVGRLSEPRVVERGEPPRFSAPQQARRKPDLPRVLLLGTGGTIASRVDYRTGAVHPAVTSSDLNALVPELSDIASIETELLINILSENMSPSGWSKMARRVSRAVEQGYAGVVITHGTDTLGYTAAALSFALSEVPIPVILTAAQRSSDRPSSDATLNLVGSVTVAARAGFAGVYVGMHLDESDDKVAFHLGTRVRKNHTSKRGAFVSVGVPLAAVWGKGGLETVADGLPLRKPNGSFRARPAFSDRVALLKFYPAMVPKFIDAARRAGIRAVVIEGTGLGHVSLEMTRALKSFVSHGGLAFMTSQCLDGRVDLNVYETGRDLVEAGVVPLEDMLPETALAKAMWVLGNKRSAPEAIRLMTTVVSGEMTTRSLPN